MGGISTRSGLIVELTSPLSVLTSLGYLAVHSKRQATQ